MPVTKINPLRNLGDLMDANADLMTQVYHDNGLSPDEKLRSFSLGIRNQCALSRDLQARRAELARHNLLQTTKPDDLQALRFIPAPAEPPSLPAPSAPAPLDAATTPERAPPAPATHATAPRLN